MNEMERINLDDYIQTDPQCIEEANRRIRPYVAAKIPFMLFIANHLNLIPPALQRLARLLD